MKLYQTYPKRFLVIDLFFQGYDKVPFEWVKCNEEMPYQDVSDKYVVGIYKVITSDGNELWAYYFNEGVWFEKETKTPLYDIIEWGKPNDKTES